MLTPYIRHDNLDDLMRDTLEAIRMHGRRIKARRGWCVEVTGVLLELTDVRARLSRTETKGTPFSALGEFCWYLSGRSDFASIDYYLRGAYDAVRDVEPDGVTISGAYGPRLIGSGRDGQLEGLIRMLTENPTTRQAVLQLFDADDLRSGQRDVPCTCTIQLLNREGRLEMVTYMRSNDAYKGLPHDVFCFTLLQEWIARRLGIEVGVYKHAVGSLHIYDENAERAQRYINEGFQSTQSPMPPMPKDDPQGALLAMLDAEEALRATPPDYARAGEREMGVNEYWADLIRLLQAFSQWKEHDEEAILQTRNRMKSTIYHPFLTRRAQNATDRQAP
ncbi:thymidylate synthase [soil metagenome]